MIAMSRTHSSSVRLSLGIALLALGRLAGATSADDAGSRIVVPLVSYEKGFATQVFVTNHENKTIKVQIRYVGEKYGIAPGLRICGDVSLPGMTVTEIDIPSKCTLPSDSGTGLVVLLERDPGVARISGYARVDVRSVPGGRTLQSLPVAGLPLAAVDTTESVHVVAGLQQTAPGSSRVLTTSCAFATFFDGSLAGGLIGRLTLKDERGVVMGSPLLFNLKPFELRRFDDVFNLLGVPQGSALGVRAEFTLTGKGDGVLGYCTTAQQGPDKGDLSLGLQLAQVANPQDEVRRRTIDTMSTPGSGAFVLAQGTAHHGIYVRHPDRFTCSVGGSAGLVITAVSPDGAMTVGGTGPKTPEVGFQPHSTLGNGVHDMWGLEITRGPGAATGPLPYSIHCDSGNGTSLADFLF
jgi:hypothetical protein